MNKRTQIEIASVKHFFFHCANFSIQRKTLFDKLTKLNIDFLTRNDDYIAETLGNKIFMMLPIKYCQKQPSIFSQQLNNSIIHYSIKSIFSFLSYDSPQASRCIMKENIPSYCSVYVCFILRVYFNFCKSWIYLIFHIILHHDLFNVRVLSNPKIMQYL